MGMAEQSKRVPKTRWERWLRTELAKFELPEGVDTVTAYAVASMCATYAWPTGAGIEVATKTVEGQLRIGRRRAGATLRWLDQIGILPVIKRHGRGTATRRELSIPDINDGALSDTISLSDNSALCNTITGANDGVDHGNDGVDHGFDGVGMPTPEQVNQNRTSSKTALTRSGVERLIATHCPDATDEDIRALVGLLAAEARTSLPGLVRTLASNGHLADRLDAVRAERHQAAISAELDAARADPALRCHHGTDGGQHVRTDTRRPLCAICAHAAEVSHAS